MNMFLHDFKTLEDYNDVAEWIRHSNLDPEKHAVIFFAHFDHGSENGTSGLMLVGNFTGLLATVTETIAQVIVSGSRDQQRALQMAGMGLGSFECNEPTTTIR